MTMPTTTKPGTPAEPTEAAKARGKKGAASRSRNGSHAKVVELPGAPSPFDHGRTDQLPAPMAHESTGTVAVFCYESPDSVIGQHVARLATALGARHKAVHLFARDPFALLVPNVVVHQVGTGDTGDLVDQVNEFNSRACNAFNRQFPNGAGSITLLGYEWSSVPALSLLHATRNLDPILALYSLERERSDMQSELSRKIDELECRGLREARSIWTQTASVVDVARGAVPECGERLVAARLPFPSHDFQHELDPGRIKERHQVGPLDPLILFIGDLDERHGADVLMKSVPAILKNQKQARFAFVGEGSLYWPLRVHARYLLLEHAVRMVGHLDGRPLFDLIQAADVIVAPSRQPTEWWPIQAAWAASRPVVASHEMAQSLGLAHEESAVLVYPHESSCVWGVERLLHDWEFARTLGAEGPKHLEERFGWDNVAEQFEALIGQRQPQ